MSESDNNSEKQRRRVVMPIPTSVDAFAGAADLSRDEVIQELGKMGIHARGNFIMPKDVLQVIGRAYGIEVEFEPPPRI